MAFTPFPESADEEEDVESEAHHTLVLGEGDSVRVTNMGPEKAHFVLIAGAWMGLRRFLNFFYNSLSMLLSLLFPCHLDYFYCVLSSLLYIFYSSFTFHILPIILEMSNKEYHW